MVIFFTTTQVHPLICNYFVVVVKTVLKYSFSRWYYNWKAEPTKIIRGKIKNDISKTNLNRLFLYINYSMTLIDTKSTFPMSGLHLLTVRNQNLRWLSIFGKKWHTYLYRSLLDPKSLDYKNTPNNWGLFKFKSKFNINHLHLPHAISIQGSSSSHL